MKKASKKNNSDKELLNLLAKRVNELTVEVNELKKGNKNSETKFTDDIVNKFKALNLKVGDEVYDVECNVIHSIKKIDEFAVHVSDCHTIHFNCFTDPRPIYIKATDVEKFKVLNIKVGDYIRSGSQYFTVYAIDYQDKMVKLNNLGGTNSWEPLFDRFISGTYVKVTEEEAVKNSDFEVGDYIKDANGVVLHKVIEIDDDSVVIGENKYKYYKIYQNKASVEEIKQHLLKDAEKRGFKVGANVLNRSRSLSGKIISIHFNKDNPGNSFNVMEYKEKYFVWVKYGNSYNTVIDQLEVVKDEDIIIKVNNVEYKADFSSAKRENGGIIKFGCAEIGIGLVIECNQIMNYAWEGNRTIESITIGKGLFTKDIIEKLYKKITESK